MLLLSHHQETLPSDVLDALNWAKNVARLRHLGDSQTERVGPSPDELGDVPEALLLPLVIFLGQRNYLLLLLIQESLKLGYVV